MKNFRSSKNLRIVDGGVAKEENSLRQKVRLLEEQIEMLQKSNLNIFIPVSEQEPKQALNLEAIINKLKIQVLGLQQEVQGLKNTVKKLESEKNIMKITHQNQLKAKQEVIEELQLSKEELQEQVTSLEIEAEEERRKRADLQKNNIEMKVQIRFLKDDLGNLKKRLEHSQNKYEQLHSNVLAVQHHSRIYSSKQTGVTAVNTAEFASLHKYIEDLQEKIRLLLEANRQEKITLGVKRQNIGQEIVRLKKNIDLQLGLPQNEATTKSFLQVYKDTTDCFDGLIRGCRK